MIVRDPISKKVRVECDFCHSAAPWASWDLLARKFALHKGFRLKNLKRSRNSWVCQECQEEYDRALAVRIEDEDQDQFPVWEV